MTRIVKKRKIANPSEGENKAQGKNLQQSGEFFQKNKNIVTWVLVIIFAMGCFGIGGLVFSGCGSSGSTANGLNPSQTIDRGLEQITYNERQLEQNPNDPLSLANLAYSYQSQAFKLKIKDDLNQSKANEQQITEYLSNAERNYTKAIEIDPNYSFAAVNLMELYNMSAKYDKAITLGEHLYKEKNLAEKTTEVSETEEGNDFSPIASKLVIAYVNSDQMENAKKYTEKALELNPSDTKLLYSLAKSNFAKKDEKDFAKSKEATTADELSKRALAIISAQMQAGPSSDETLEVIRLKDGLDILVLRGDITSALGNKEEAGMAYQMASTLAKQLQNEELFAELNNKAIENGAKPQVSIQSQEETPEGDILIHLTDGRTLTIPKSAKEQAVKDKANSDNPVVPQKVEVDKP